jgi:hypothetical protein
MLPSVVLDALSDPSPQEWHQIARWLDTHDPSPELLSQLAKALKKWPRELPRDPLKHWTQGANGQFLKLCLRVPEVTTYNYYLAMIHSAPQLALSTGQPGVRLQRFFSGAAQVQDSDTWIRIGQAGQGDLVGITTIELAATWIGVYTELEVKTPKGVQSDTQKVREEIVRAKGGIYLLAKSVRSAVDQLAAERARLRAALAR